MTARREVLVVVFVVACAPHAPIAARGPGSEALAVVPTAAPLDVQIEAGGARFGRVGEPLAHRAAIFVGPSLEVALPSEAVSQAGWVDVIACDPRLFAVADADVESPGPTLEVFVRDAGVWQHLASLEKPHYTGRYAGLSCDADRIAARVVWDPVTITTGRGRARGEVAEEWTSDDGGLTWRGPTRAR